MTYEVQVLTAVDTIIDCCAYHKGTECDCCEASKLCCCKKPIDLLNKQEVIVDTITIC